MPKGQISLWYKETFIQNYKKSRYIGKSVYTYIIIDEQYDGDCHTEKWWYIAGCISTPK